MGIRGAYLSIDNVSLWLREVKMGIDRQLDDAFRLVPESTVIEFTMVFPPTTDPLMQTWMTSPGLKRDGAVVYLDPEGNPTRVTRFWGGYCQQVGQDYDSRPDATAPYVTRLVVRVESVSIDPVETFSFWPPLPVN